MTATGNAGPGVEDREAVPPLPAKTGALLTAAIALLIAMGELSRLTGQAVDDQGRVWPLNTLMGVASWSLDPQSWGSQPVGNAGALGTWLCWYLVLDFVFIALYGGLGVHLVSSEGPWRAAGWALLGLAAVDIAEDLLALFNGRPTRASAPVWLDDAVVVASRLKWLGVAVVIVLVVRAAYRIATQPGAMAQMQGTGRSLRKAIYTQRFSLVFIVPAALLSLIPGADILDQLPDVERAWVQPGRAKEAFWAIGVALLGAVALFVLGRLRSGDMYRWLGVAADVRNANARDGDGREKSRLRRWYLVPVPFVIAGGIGWAAGWGSIDQTWRMLVLAGVAFAIAALSGWIRWSQRHGRGWAWVRRLKPKAKRSVTPGTFRATALFGDVAAVAVVVVSGLAMVRSFTAPVALGVIQPLESAWPLVALLAAAGASVLVWPLSALALASIEPRGWLTRLLTPGVAAAVPRGLGGAVIPAGLVVLLIIFANLPGSFGSIGVVAALLLLLLLVALTLGSLTVLAQDRRPPEVFWISVLGRQVTSAPVFSLLVIVILLASLNGGATSIHGVRGTGESAVSAIPERPDLVEAFAAWDAATAGCGRTVMRDGRAFRIRIMPMLAAEGGGIRAAYWASAGVDLLSGRYQTVRDVSGRPVGLRNGELDNCRVAFFSGGASGGAVGLTVSRFAKNLSGHEQVVAMADSSALGRAALGLVVRDMLYPITGIPLASGGGPGWRDRAALIEDAWANEWKPAGVVTSDTAGALSGDFLPVESAEAVRTPPGYLILNSTSVSTACRVLVSQVELPGPSGARTGSIECDLATAFQDNPEAGDQLASVANSLDFFGYYAGPAARGCTGNLRAATAAMLAARFPYVTPSGVVGPCSVNSQQTDQLIDGGYVENSGVGTIVDLSSLWLELVRAHNDKALAAAESVGVADLIVPMVVYFDNDTAGDLAVTPPGPTLEALVPPIGFWRARAALNTAATLLQRAQSVVDADGLWSPQAPGAASAEKALERVRPRGVVVVNQFMAPAVTAPLGWSMSSQSVASMNSALMKQATEHCAERLGDDDVAMKPENQGVVCDRGYGSLADALEAFGVR